MSEFEERDSRVLRVVETGRLGYFDGGGAFAASPRSLDTGGFAKLEELLERYLVRARLAEARLLVENDMHTKAAKQVESLKLVADGLAARVAWFEETFNVSAPSSIPVLTVGCRRCHRSVSQHYIGQHLDRHNRDPEWDGRGDPVDSDPRPWTPHDINLHDGEDDE